MPVNARYLRRHTHDVRNCLAAMDLQTVLLQRTSGAQSESDYLATIRKLVGWIDEMQTRLGIRFQSPAATELSLSTLFEQCKTRQRIASADKEIAWSFEGSDCWFRADSQAASVIIVEISDYWLAPAGGSIRAFEHGGNACVQMQRARIEEPCPDAEVREELAALVARYSGTLTWEADGQNLTVAFGGTSVTR